MEDKRKMKFDEEKVLEILALAIGTTNGAYGKFGDHHLDYLLKKLYGLDGLLLDEENYKIFERLVKIKEKYPRSWARE